MRRQLTLDQQQQQQNRIERKEVKYLENNGIDGSHIDAKDGAFSGGNHASSLPDATSSSTTTTRTTSIISSSSNTIQNTIPISSTPTSSQLTTQQEEEQLPFEKSGLSHSTAMSQMVLLPDDMNLPSKYLPQGISDINGHQLDLRKTNSWLLKIDQVSTPELIECMFINTIAPFVLNSRLQSLLKTIPNGSNDEMDRPDRYIINVSAMEGKFYRYKMPNHPHTNMAKASLNMMTRTSAEDLAKNHRIYMNSVDTVCPRKCCFVSIHFLNCLHKTHDMIFSFFSQMKFYKIS